jgi:hypothetical protein
MPADIATRKEAPAGVAAGPSTAKAAETAPTTPEAPKPAAESAPAVKTGPGPEYVAIASPMQETDIWHDATGTITVVASITPQNAPIVVRCSSNSQLPDANKREGGFNLEVKPGATTMVAGRRIVLFNKGSKPVEVSWRVEMIVR